MILSRESSPFDSSPHIGSSPRDFWKGQTSASRFASENLFEQEQSPSVVKRRSIEKLKQASRVKNSSMFAREQKNEYDPTSVPVVERPLAAHRPLTVQLQGNAYGGRGVEGFRHENTAFKGHRRGESQNRVPLLSPLKSDAPSPEKSDLSPSPSPLRQLPSPTKSSLSSKPTHNTFPRAFDPQSGMWSDEDDDEPKISPPRALRRHAKSVTFDTGPPEVNEYEMVTPDPSSVASGSRQGSYDSYDDEENDSIISLDQTPSDVEDSFDASLEDTDKTPVVLPEDWQHMSPENATNALANTFDDPFDENETGRSTPSQQWNAYRTASVNSDSDPRPLPPVPGFLQNTSRPGSASGLSSVMERVQAAHASRSLPTPPRAAVVSKSEILGMKRDSSVTVDDRLRMMGLDEQTSPQDPGAKEVARLRKHGLGIHVFEDEVLEDDTLKTEDFKFPRISRESILRKVKSRTFDHNDDYDLANLDPDVAIPSREVSSNFDDDIQDVLIKQEKEDSPVDLYSIAEMYSVERDEEYARESSVIHHDMSAIRENEVQDDAESCYSSQSPADAVQHISSGSGTDEEGPPTPKQENIVHSSTPRISGDNVGDIHMNLPEFSSFIDDVDFQSGLASYLSSSSTPPPPQVPEKDATQAAPAHSVSQKLDMSSVHQYFQLETSERHTPEAQESDVPEPGTPESVVHHPAPPFAAQPGRDSPDVPEQMATVKAPGGKLKVRPSATPADMEAMAAVRRQVSGQHPPPIPDKSPKRRSMSLELDVQHDEPNEKPPVSPTKRRQSFKKLDIAESSFGDDISFGLDEEFDRVIESSKVALYPVPSPPQIFPTAQTAEKQNHQNNSAYLVSEYVADLTPRTKKGYLMRQNTKVVIAKRNFSNESGGPMSPTFDQRPLSAQAHGTRSAGNSPRKGSLERAKSWTTEPWNGKARRKSIRTTSGSKKVISAGPVPPMPGQESAVTGLDTVMEDQIMTSADAEDLMGEGVERGRLFVKVVGVKDLELPLPPSRYQMQNLLTVHTNLVSR